MNSIATIDEVVDHADLLKRWDAGDPIWSIEMGGLGPSHEQCIQISPSHFSGIKRGIRRR